MMINHAIVARTTITKEEEVIVERQGQENAQYRSGQHILGPTIIDCGQTHDIAYSSKYCTLSLTSGGATLLLDDVST